MKEKRKIIPSEGAGFFQNIATHLKLVWRLMTDDRVNPFLKLIPFGTLIYFVLPLDVPGPIDDVAVIWLGTLVFIELCPPEIVAEHRKQLADVIPGTWKDVGPEKKPDQYVIDEE